MGGYHRPAMKPYSLSIEIDLPREQVVERFDDPRNLAAWQPGFVSWTLIEGTQGQPGARAAVVFQNGKHRIDMTEIVTENALPDSMSGRYEWGGNFNTLTNRFIDLGDGRTRWEVECAYTLRTLMMRIMGLLFASRFRAQHMVFMRAFKAYCESGEDMRDAS